MKHDFCARLLIKILSKTKCQNHYFNAMHFRGLLVDIKYYQTRIDSKNKYFTRMHIISENLLRI